MKYRQSQIRYVMLSDTRQCPMSTRHLWSLNYIIFSNYHMCRCVSVPVSGVHVCVWWLERETMQQSWWKKTHSERKLCIHIFLSRVPEGWLGILYKLSFATHTPSGIILTLIENIELTKNGYMVWWNVS